MDRILDALEEFYGEFGAMLVLFLLVISGVMVFGLWVLFTCYYPFPGVAIPPMLASAMIWYALKNGGNE